MRRPIQGWRMPSRVMDAAPELQAMLDQVASSSPDPAPDTPVVMTLGPGIWRTSQTLRLKCAAGKNNRTIRIEGAAAGATIIAPKDNGPRDCAPNTNLDGNPTSELLSINVTSAGGPPMKYVGPPINRFEPGGVPYELVEGITQGGTDVVLRTSAIVPPNITPPATPPTGYYVLVGAEFVRGQNSGLTSFGYATGELVFLQGGTIRPNGDREMTIQPIPGVRPYPSSFDPYQSHLATVSPDQAGTDFPATFQNPSPNIAAGLLTQNNGYAFLLEPITNFSNDLVIRRVDLVNLTFVGWTPDDFDRSTPVEARRLRPRNQGIFATALANVHLRNLTITGTHSNAAQFFGCRNLFIENCHTGGNQPFNELPAAAAPYQWYRGSYQNYGMVFSLCRGVAILGGSSWRSRKSHQITNGTNDVRWERTVHVPNSGYDTRANPPDGRIFAPIVDVGHGFNHRRITVRGIDASASSWDIANPGFRRGIRDVLIESCAGITFFVYSNPQNLVFR